MLAVELVIMLGLAGLTVLVIYGLAVGLCAINGGASLIVSTWPQGCGDRAGRLTFWDGGRGWATRACK